MNKGKGKTLSLVVPVFDEEDNLDELIDRCVTTCDRLGRTWEMILVDDGSSDRSRDVIEAKSAQYAGRVSGVFLNRNYGQHCAVICGLAHTRGDTVITLDADLQNPPEEIPRLLAEADAGYDVVGTVRTPRRDSLFRRLASHMINVMVKRATGVTMHDYGCMLRAYSRSVVDAVLECRERSTFVPVLATGFARRTTEIEVEHHERRAGKSKYGVLRLVHLMFDLMTMMTTAPLRALTFFGGALSVSAVAFGVLLLVLRFAYGAQWAADGVFTLFAVVFFLLGAQFMAMGLLGEYVGRIQVDVRERPRYVIDRSVGGSANGAVRAPRPVPASREPLESR